MKYVSTRGKAPVLAFDDVLLAGLAVAVPTPSSGDYEWAVTQWTAGCTAQDGCQYQFVITGPAADEKPPTPALPAFEASCLRGALPPVDLRAVCLVRAMSENVVYE